MYDIALYRSMLAREIRSYRRILRNKDVVYLHRTARASLEGLRLAAALLRQTKTN